MRQVKAVLLSGSVLASMFAVSVRAQSTTDSAAPAQPGSAPSATAALQTTAGSQPTSGAPPSGGVRIEEVIVTARRRAENIQSVPVAVTALSGSTLQRESVTTAYDLPRVAPSLNVNISAGGGQNQVELSIRGQRQGDTPPSLDPSVGIYFGDIVLERPYGFSQSLFDLSNVQILKGPQGTLFGRNTTGGAIVLQPNLPTDSLDGSIHAGVGDYNFHEVDGYVNLPMSDKAALRIAVQHTDRDGYIHDLTTGKHDENEDESAVRVSLRLRPTAQLENTTVANYLIRDTNATGFKLFAVTPNTPVAFIYGPAGPAAAAQSNSLGYYDLQSGGQRGYAHLRTYTIANTTTYQLTDSITMKNILGFVHYHSHQFDDLDGSQLPILSYGTNQYGNQATEEFQILGKSRTFNWIAGAYYFREGAYYQSYTPDELNPVLIGYQIPQAISEQDVNTSKSLFGSGTYDFSDFIPHVSATFGGRYTWDDRDDRYGTVYAVGYTPGEATPLQGLNPLAPPSPGTYCGFATSPTPVNFAPSPDCRVHQKVSFSKFTYNVDLDYKLTPDKLLYFAHRLGYRTGGFGTRGVTAPQLAPFAPETVNDYEIGAKLDWRYRGMFLRTNIAGYYQDYSNIQRLVSFTVNGTTSTNVQNAASATIDGAEFEFLFVPREGIEISGFFSQTQPKYQKFIVGLPSGATQDVSKTAPFAGFPRTTFGFTGRFGLPVPREYGSTVFQVNYYHQSPFLANDDTSLQPFGVVEGYQLTNLRLEWNGVMGTKLDLAGFVNNLFDLKHHASDFPLTTPNLVGFASTVAAPPRMFGVEGRYHFGG